MNRKQAHELARYKELLLSVAHPEKEPSPHDADHRRTGYHIVASVYQWNIDREAATRGHACFLDDADGCLRHRNLELFHHLVRDVILRNALTGGQRLL